MKHLILVVPHGSDSISAEIELNVTVAELQPVMGWENENDYLYDYKLTAQQISGIERLISQSLPRNVELYLSCDA
ncbi:recombination regulator RecX [Pseudomonas sp. FW306-02-F02-AA]|uniref:DUF7683 domain-containing protein n=1 Tax=Pseudomonas fluorescens TaxID=294 RepID=A0A0N9W5K2_PSEFL|nr:MULTISPECIES: hypothetical protein [Pseudomonas]ALI01746.1 hypothetical protein AO353_11895 [Pseudomonas fluorescens]PMZ05223.1 recombination regulator RecX [Pseudomonas sp. FW306-02-F02-AB]PMZ08630.1 recombination regulator RecX [Pseudomonas sp. FW306-02-H06C]PMZ14548.1 recombination regulator RecX [Pseudomonas sp. FW306-02-F02-AA]PMZ19902.1 recombination regulator RecX [Pseudomonas sp. FW306-02-F08-AA]